MIGACLATNDCKGAAPNKMSRVVIAILAYTIAAEYALMCEEGPGRFMPIFLDVLHEMAANPDGRIMNNSQRWVDRAHILVMDS